VEKLDNCSLGTGESLNLSYDPSAWDQYAITAVRLANFISKIITSNNNSMAALSDEVLFALVRNNVHLHSVIFGSGIPLEPHESLRYPLFCPYAYRNENKTVVLSKDLAVEYNYTDPRTEYYQVLRYKDYTNISIETDVVHFRLSIKSQCLIIIKMTSFYGIQTIPDHNSFYQICKNYILKKVVIFKFMMHI
jgi:hypothetical protein